MAKVIIIRKKTFRSLSMDVERDGTVVVKAPPSVSEERISQFIEKNRDWINKVIKKYEEHNFLVRYQDGEKFLYLGNEYELEIVDTQREPLKLEDKFYLSSKALSQARETFLAWYKKQAQSVITKRVEYYAQLGGYHYNKVSIKELKKIWGSCSKNRNLTFNWAIIMAPIDVLDYVVIHELSHLREFNHTKKFWDEVSKLMPDYEEKERWLYKNGHLLGL